MENYEVSRRTVLKGGGAALAGMTALRVAGPAQAFPGHPDEVLIPGTIRPRPSRSRPRASSPSNWNGSSSTPG
jgi:hypothetical protein